MDPMKDFFLFLAKRTFLQKLMSTSGPAKIISKRFISGETLENGITAAKELNKRGIKISLDNLGESVENEKAALESAQEYFNILNRIKSENSFDISVSLKLTQMGLDISDEFCLKNMREIMDEAQKSKKLVTIDMESSAYTDRTLNIFQQLRKEGFSGTGIVIQAYLTRTEKDIRNLLSIGPRVRLCKGAYKESASVAFSKKKDVDANYIKVLSILFSQEALKNGAYSEVATHDDKIINWTIDFVKNNHIPLDKFEFQMLYGIRRDLQEKLVKHGYRLRVYLPYGTHWYPYFMRRLAERPANVWFVLKGSLR
ncbi:MAG: proline dehydrogenase family protein [Planctomycetota bacterium]